METDFTLPRRTGESPRVTVGIPHIQLDQTSTPDMLAKLTVWAFSLDGVVEQPSRASLPGAKALTVAPELPVRAEAMIVGREFGHIHPKPNGSGSLHLRLPEDHANEVVDRGWGEWHPFAIDGTMVGMVMVYAPRSDEDFGVVQTIIGAAATYAMSAVDGQ
jgi:phospholipase/carboxylesterase